MIFEHRAVGEVDRRRVRRRGSRLPSSPTMCSSPSNALPTEPGCASQSCDCDRAEAVAFGAGVVFVDHRSPPLDHLALAPGRGRGRRRGSATFMELTSYLLPHLFAAISAYGRTSWAPTGCGSSCIFRFGVSASSGSKCSITMRRAAARAGPSCCSAKAPRDRAAPARDRLCLGEIRRARQDAPSRVAERRARRRSVCGVTPLGRPVVPDE